MKIIIILALISVSITSCKKEENFEIVNMRINHYQQPVNNAELFYGMAYLSQQDDKIGTENWSFFSYNISGFDYEFGYVYDLTVNKEFIEEPLIDHPGVVYSLGKINSKTKIDIEKTFEIILSIKYFNGFQSFLKKDESSNYYLFTSNVLIDCGELYDELTANIENEKGMKGTFRHIDSQTIKLLSIDLE
nr:DUF4377 domain-containing protein [uncultured Draconibacterium sp.]